MAAIFLLGIGIGVSGALLVRSGPEPRVAASGNIDGAVRTEDEGFTLSVKVASSDRAKATYEEQLQNPPTPAPVSIPDTATPLPLPATPANEVLTVEPETVPFTPNAQGDPVLATPSPATTFDGEQPWIQFAAHTSIDPARPMIAIVIDDVGLDQPRSRRAIALEGPMTIAILPYGYNLRELASAARANGHELLVHVPMEPLDPEANPGPQALLTGLDDEEIRKRILWDLAQFDGFVGINNHMGSRFTAYEAGMRVVIEEARARGLLFLDSVTSRQTKGFHLARSAGIPYAVRDVFLDHDISIPAINAQLRKVEQLALRQGHAIAIGHPHDATMEALIAWLPAAKAKGFQIVPITAIVRARLASG